MERYRSGHNGADSKSVRPKGLVGSNPTRSAKSKSAVLSHLWALSCAFFVAISIHTPVKDVTWWFCPVHPRDPYFNPHIRKGCDGKQLVCQRSEYHFNPHIREGCDTRSVSWTTGIGEFQSTHPWRMWPIDEFIVDCLIRFQSTHPWRMWLPPLATPNSAGIIFQSTHPWRMWPKGIWPGNHHSRYFNPHIREGCDAALQTAIMAALNISIHTSVKDVTSIDDRYLHPMQISIHTSVKDVTLFYGIYWPRQINFNPHIREGCDPTRQCYRAASSHFNPHIREGCDWVVT